MWQQENLRRNATRQGHKAGQTRKPAPGRRTHPDAPRHAGRRLATCLTIEKGNLTRVIQCGQHSDNTDRPGQYPVAEIVKQKPAHNLSGNGKPAHEQQKPAVQPVAPQIDHPHIGQKKQRQQHTKGCFWRQHEKHDRHAHRAKSAAKAGL